MSGRPREADAARTRVASRARTIIQRLVATGLVVAGLAAGVAYERHRAIAGETIVRGCGDRFFLGQKGQDVEHELLLEPCSSLIRRRSVTEAGGTLLGAQAPGQYLSDAWLLLLELDGSGLVSIRYRTDDSVARHPDRAPDDRERPRAP